MRALLVVLALAAAGCGESAPEAAAPPHPEVVPCHRAGGCRIYRACDGTTAIYITYEGVAAVANGCPAGAR